MLIQVLLHILQFDQDGLVTHTFQWLDAERQQAVVHATLAEATLLILLQNSLYECQMLPNLS